MSNFEDFSISFDTPTIGTDKHYENSNVLSKREQNNYNESVNKQKKFSAKLNPFSIEMVVTLNLSNSLRYQFIVNPNATSEAKISEILGSDYVNIASWDTFPNVIKNVPIADLILHPQESIKNKLKVALVKFIRKVFFIK